MTTALFRCSNLSLEKVRRNLILQSDLFFFTIMKDIILSGIQASGKGTQARLLLEHF
ncbi:MAG: hypothetical protein LBD11_07325 [Candidatus Peribacteria bacterium]|jgi:hypothetical protein|nr:hypothetical protein [Candidatus Peribacteria bacterium]